MFKTIVVAAVCLLTTIATAQRSTPLQLLHPSAAASDSFGNAVAVDGDTLIVGSSVDDIGANADQGSAHVYRWTGSGWTLEATLTAPGGGAIDYFGSSVAISGDTAIVGAYGDNVGPNANQGSVYVFTRTGSTWTQQAQLTAAGGAAADLFGWSVAISGDTAIVGAPYDDVGANANQGSAYAFVRTGSAWTQQAQVTAVGGASGDLLGSSVAVSGDTAIVGAHLDDVGANTDQGSAYIFTRSGSTWIPQAQLTAAGGAANDWFGVSVAISGDVAIAGAYLDDVGANADQGSAYVFTRIGSTWTQQAQVNATGGEANDGFGVFVAVSGDTAIVGAPLDDVGANANQGSAFAFTRSGSTWTQRAHLTATGGAANAWFGVSVAISGDTAIVGAYLDDVGVNNDQGSAWTFSRVSSKWIGPDLSMFAAGGAVSDSFGTSVAISGDTAIVGAYRDDVGANVDQGSAYVFIRTGSTWTQQAQLTAAGGAADDWFGFSVAISGDTAIVGAYSDDVGANVNQGSAYVFVRTGSTWTQQAQLTAADGAAFDFFGVCVAISGDTAIVGAIYDDVGANASQGSAYVFVRAGSTWTQQTQLTAAGGAADDYFGGSVVVSGNTAIVGAARDDVGANVDQGSACVFVRNGSTWTQQAQLTAADGAANDDFGGSVAISGETAIVGADSDDVGVNVGQGSACVFVRTGSTWSQQAQLTAADGAAFDFFGVCVAISGDTALVGASVDMVGANFSQGSAYVFTRAGSTWTQQAQLTAAGGAARDYFGVGVAISGDTAIVGANSDDVGASFDQGSAWTFDVAANDFSRAHNDVTNVSAPSLAAAVLPAASGQQITATEAAWRSIGSLNTLGRSLSLRGSGDIRTPSTSSVELGGSSVLEAADAVEIFGNLRVSSGSSADLAASDFRLGSRGILTARTNASLSINASTAELDGQTRLEQGASLTFAGTAEAIGSTTCAFESTLTAATSFTNIDTFTITAGTINTPLFWNRAQFNVFGSSAIFGNLLNNVLATTTIRSGTLFVFGDLTNNGTVIGTICSTCSGLPPSMDVGGTLSLGPAANLTMPFVGSTVHLGGSFDCAINANTRFDLAQATLQLQSARHEVTLEVMSRDIGVDALGLDRSRPGHFPIGELHIGGSPTTVRLIDAHDNALDGTGACEALYVDTLRIDAGSRLINTTCRIYYNTLINGGTVDVPENLIALQGTPCPADFNMDGGVDGGDVVDFFAAWEGGDSMADVNQDGGVDGGDIDVFFAAWEAGGC
jgi:hypothetical protein